jgi:hypothetical protein
MYNIDTSPFLDFSPESYPLFFQHFDQRLQSKIADREDCYQVVNPLPDRELLANLDSARIGTLWLSQFIPNLLPIGTSKPGNHGNWNYTEPQTGTALSGRLWQSIGKQANFEWVVALLDLTVATYSDRPMTISNFSYTNRLGKGYYHLDGDGLLIDWVTKWIEPNCYAIGTGLAGNYTIGSQFLPIFGANIVSIINEESFNLAETIINKVGWTKQVVFDRGIEVDNIVGFVTRTEKDISTRKSGEITVERANLTSNEGSPNSVSWLVDQVIQYEGTRTANRVGWSEARTGSGGD